MRRVNLISLAALLLPAAAAAQDSAAGPKQSDQTYEGWRQYSVHCARCHGQDVLGNPVAANLLVTVAPGGTTSDRKAFSEVVAKGRTSRGMPAFGETLTPEQIDAIYAYVKGRADKKIPPGRPKEPKG
jgi:mono/diheme cytochrome c family protein